MSGGANAGFLDTLALAYHLTGATGKALEIQRQAIALLPPSESSLRSELETRLAEYGAALRRK